MVDASFSRQRKTEDGAALPIRQLWIFAVALAVILAGLGFALLKRDSAGNGTSTAVPVGRQVSIDLLEMTKGLLVTQQQAVDQLQVVQDQLAAQKGETKRLSEEIAALTEKFGVLQRSVSDIPASSVLPTGSQPKSRSQ